MAEVTDDQVFGAVDAYETEMAAWRFITVGHSFLATDIHRHVPLQMTAPGEPQPAKKSFETHEFRDEKTATAYVAWRAMKAALEITNAQDH